MFEYQSTFSSHSVDDLDAAKEFYGSTLGLELTERPEGIEIALRGGGRAFIYEKPNHAPASYTVLNFEVSDIDDAVDSLGSRGVNFQRYDSLPAEQDEKGILRGGIDVGHGPDIAWFCDPAGNILSVVQGA